MRAGYTGKMKRIGSCTALLAVILVGIWGCSEGDSGEASAPVALTCGSSSQQCNHYVGPYWEEPQVRELCNATGQIGFNGSPCAADNLVGRCQYRPDRDADREILFHYYAPNFTSDSAREHCEGLGDSGDWLG